MKRGARQRAWVLSQRPGYGEPGVLYPQALVFAPTKRVAKAMGPSAGWYPGDFRAARDPRLDHAATLDRTEQEHAMWLLGYRVDCDGFVGCPGGTHGSTSHAQHPRGIWREGKAYCCPEAHEGVTRWWAEVSGGMKGLDAAVRDRFPAMELHGAHGMTPHAGGFIPVVGLGAVGFRFDPRTETAYWQDDAEFFTEAQVRAALDAAGYTHVRLLECGVQPEAAQ